MKERVTLHTLNSIIDLLSRLWCIALVNKDPFAVQHSREIF